MPWILLITAGLFEVVWAFTMKQSEGFTKLGPSVITIIAMLISFGLLAMAMRALPLGTAYTIWTGIGAIGAFIVGIVVLGEPANMMRIIAGVLIISGAGDDEISQPGIKDSVLCCLPADIAGFFVTTGAVPAPGSHLSLPGWRSGAEPPAWRPGGCHIISERHRYL